MRVERQQDLGPNPLKTKIISIGNWDMQGTASVSIAHGLTYADIRHVQAMIRKDDDSLRSPITFCSGAGVAGGSSYWNLTNVVLSRTGGGPFDSANYNLSPFVRGDIIISYL